MFHVTKTVLYLHSDTQPYKQKATNKIPQIGHDDKYS